MTDSRRMAVARLEGIQDDSPTSLGRPGAGTGRLDAESVAHRQPGDAGSARRGWGLSDVRHAL